MKRFRLSFRIRILGLLFALLAGFLGVVFGWLLPAVEEAINNEKQLQTRHLVQAALGILQSYHEREAKGELTRSQAQSQAMQAVKALRYGPEGKDYFWINDFKPVMIMHPFRSDLDGKDLSDFKDPQGKALFMEFVRVCRELGEGFVPYQWQWKDDKTRIVPKLSYVKAFAPWGWILGTGIYVKDVAQYIGGLRRNFLLVFIPVALLLGLAFLIMVRDLQKLVRMAGGLSAIAREVKGASSQVAESSRNLAQGAAEQAAALEETSSSLEEMSTMTRANASHARQADTLMEESALVVETANRSMAELTQAMKEVSAASEDTAKIIKTIDEIAFQTNLLALNAAVEAARAGEAGAGFAVVADEVRSLAMRAAEAAKNTARLIDTTVSRVKEGSALVGQTAAGFSQVSGSTAKVKELVSEIAAASGEQAQGVDQINRAIQEMNQVTQKTAAGAQESASVSTELSGQSEKVNAYVQEMTLVIGGNRGLSAAGMAAQGGGPRALPGAGRFDPKRRLPAPARTPGKAAVPPNPLADEQFQDF